MPATLIAGQSADLYAKTSGYIAAVAVDIGHRVERGDALLTIDVPEMADDLLQGKAVLESRKARALAMKAKVVQAESAVTTARADVGRYEAELELNRVTTQRQQQLYEANAIPTQALDEVNSQLAIAQAQVLIANARVAAAEAERQSFVAEAAVAESDVAVENARVGRIKTMMAYATLRAPFDGVITRRMVDPGAFVRSAAEGATTPLLAIADDGFIRLVLEIPEVDAPYVDVGTPVEVDARAFDSEPIKATVTRSAHALDPATRTMRVEVDLDNAAGRLSPGMYAQVSVMLETKEQAMVIPSKAVRVRGRDTSVLVVTAGVVRDNPITLGYDDGIWAEVVAGLSGEERIVVAAGSGVAPGTTVTPVAAKPSAWTSVAEASEQ